MLPFVLLLLGPPARAEPAAAPVIRVAVGPLQAVLDPLAERDSKKDAADFTSFLLVNLSRRKACRPDALPALYARLLPHMEKAAGEEPTRFHYFTVLAPRFDEARVTAVFAALHDDPASFSRHVREQVRFLATAPADPAAPDKDAPPADAAVDFNETALREYRRYQLGCPVIFVREEGGPEPPKACNFVHRDLAGFVEKVAGESFTPSGR